jgi:hypothetical protein
MWTADHIHVNGRGARHGPLLRGAASPYESCGKQRDVPPGMRYVRVYCADIERSSSGVIGFRIENADDQPAVSVGEVFFEHLAQLRSAGQMQDTPWHQIWVRVADGLESFSKVISESGDFGLVLCVWA